MNKAIENEYTYGSSIIYMRIDREWNSLWAERLSDLLVQGPSIQSTIHIRSVCIHFRSRPFKKLLFPFLHFHHLKYFRENQANHQARVFFLFLCVVFRQWEVEKRFLLLLLFFTFLLHLLHLFHLPSSSSAIYINIFS